jgi:dTMP kinase
MAKHGRLICCEGPDGVGKSTISRQLAKELHAVWTREPTEQLVPRLVAPDWGEYLWWEHATLFAADRAIHLHDVIRPALAAGETVVCDRYELSTFVYQLVDAGCPLPYDRNPDVAHVQNFQENHLRSQLQMLAHDNAKPDLVMVFELPDVELSKRIASRGLPLSYYEQPERQALVRRRYSVEAEIMSRNGVRLWTVDASGSEAEVLKRCLEVISETFRGDT